MSAGKTLEFRLYGKDQGLSDAFDKAGDSADKFGDKLSGLKATAATAGAGAAAALAAGLMNGLEVESANNKLAAQLGATGPEAARLGDIAGKLYAGAYGESLGDVNEAMRAVIQSGTVMADESSEQIESITGKAIRLADVFDQDVVGVTNAAAQLMRTGLAPNAEMAMDIIARGFQEGADKSGDFLDTINEYGTQFRKMGLNGATAVGILTQGIEAGARDADKVADAIKEFSIRAVDGSETTADGFKAIGLNAKTMAADIAAGGRRSQDALDLTLDRLRAIEDPVKRGQAAVALFGTQAEDLGDALYAIDVSKAREAMGEVEGAAAAIEQQMGQNAKTTITQFTRSLQAGFTESAAAAITWGQQHQSTVVPALALLASVAGVVLAVGAATRVWAAAQAVASVATGVWTAAQWLLNAAFWASPITWIVAGIVAVIAVIVLIATKTTWFQSLWSGAMRGISAAVGWVKNAAASVWNWIKGNWPLLLAIITGPIGIAVGLVVRHFDKILATARAIPGQIKGFFSGAGTWLLDAGRKIVRGLIDGISGMLGSLRDKISSAAGIVRNFWPFSPAKEGPLRDHPMDEAGRNVVGMLAEGMAAEQPRLARVVGGTAGIARGAAGGGVSGLIGGGGGVTVVVNVTQPLASAEQIASAVVPAINTATRRGTGPRIARHALAGGTR